MHVASIYEADNNIVLVAGLAQNTNPYPSVCIPFVLASSSDLFQKVDKAEATFDDLDYEIWARASGL